METQVSPVLPNGRRPHPSGHSPQAVTPRTSRDCHSVPGPGHRPVNKVASATTSMEGWGQCRASPPPEGSLAAAG